jgi:hypothetical protein
MRDIVFDLRAIDGAIERHIALGGLTGSEGQMSDGAGNEVDDGLRRIAASDRG